MGDSLHFGEDFLKFTERLAEPSGLLHHQDGGLALAIELRNKNVVRQRRDECGIGRRVEQRSGG